MRKNTVAVQSAPTVLYVSESSEKVTGLAEPFKKSATGSAPVQSAAGLAGPDKPAPKGLAGPCKTAVVKKRTHSIPVRRLALVSMGGAWVDADGGLNPKTSPSQQAPSPPEEQSKNWG